MLLIIILCRWPCAYAFLWCASVYEMKETVISLIILLHMRRSPVMAIIQHLKSLKLFLFCLGIQSADPQLQTKLMLISWKVKLAQILFKKSCLHHGSEETQISCYCCYCFYQLIRFTFLKLENNVNGLVYLALGLGFYARLSNMKYLGVFFINALKTYPIN